MRLVIMQPSYLPWVGYFDLFLRADLFLVYDHVQFDKDSWRNRNRIKTAQGAQWLTVPVLTKGLEKPTNQEIRINNADPWKKKHLKSLEMNYRKASAFSDIFPLVEDTLSQDWDRLLDLNMSFLHKINKYLNISTPMQFSSDLKIPLSDDKNEKLIQICQHLGADEFYEPEGGKSYIDPQKFTDAGIQLQFQNFSHPKYHQLYGEFVSHLSVLDLLFNCGRESESILRNASEISMNRG